MTSSVVPFVLFPSFQSLPPLFTTAQLAEYLGISTKKIGELCAQRKLGYVLIGKKARRFTEDMVRHYIDTQSRVFDENGKSVKVQPRKINEQPKKCLKSVDSTQTKLLSCKEELDEKPSGRSNEKTLKQRRKELRELCR